MYEQEPVSFILLRVLTGESVSTIGGSAGPPRKGSHDSFVPPDFVLEPGEMSAGGLEGVCKCAAAGSIPAVQSARGVLWALRAARAHAWHTWRDACGWFVATVVGDIIGKSDKKKTPTATHVVEYKQKETGLCAASLARKHRR